MLGGLSLKLKLILITIGNLRMKKGLLVTTALLAFVSAPVFALECTTIQDGYIAGSDERTNSNLIEIGYDDWGYNYQAHLFNGGYCDSYADADWCQAYTEVDLVMKWNDAWLSNMDCTGSGKLDRHFPHATYIDSGAWLTNHQSGKVEVNGKLRKWTYSSKIIAVNSDDTLANGNWVRPNGVILGPAIWGPFAIVQEVYNDPSEGAHGILFKSPSAPGLGQGLIQQ